MAYPLSSPIDITDENPVTLKLTNTTGNKVWNVKTDVNDHLILGTETPASERVLVLKPDSAGDPDGCITTPKIGLEGPTNTINLLPDPLTSSSYDYTFPPVPIASAGQITVSSGTSANSFADLHAKNTIRVRKNPGPTEFSSITSAIASIPVSPDPNFPDFDNPWVIKIAAGSYTENAISVPSYVYLLGDSMESVSVYQNGVGFSLFTFSAPSGLAFMGIGNTDPNFPALDCNNCGDFLIFHKITVVENVSKFLSCVTDGAATDNSIVYLEYVDTTAVTDYTVLCQDTNASGGFGSTVSAENFFTFEHSNDSVIIDGLNSLCLIHAAEMQSDGSGNCFRVKNGGILNVRSTAILSYGNGILVDNDGSAPKIVAAGITYEDCTLNINVLNPLTTGEATGYTEYTKTSVPKEAPFFITGKNQQIITVGEKGSDFSSVVAALASITDNSVTNRYIIYLAPGIYVETQIVMKPFVSVVGFFQTACILLSDPSLVGQPFIVGAGYSALDKVTLSCATYVAPPSYLVEFTGDPTGVHFRCDNVVFDSSADLVHVGTSSGPCIFLALNPLINMAAPFVNGFVFDDDGISPMIFTIDNLIWGADSTGVSAVQNVISMKSSMVNGGAYQNISGVITGCSLGTNFYGPAGTGFCIEGSVYCVIDSCVFGGMTQALQVLPSAEPTFLILSSGIISNNASDIDIQSSTAFGSININATISKVNINGSAVFGVTIFDENGSSAFGGELYQGKGWNEITNISEQLQHASSTGIIQGQTSITDAGGLNVSVGGGTGYVAAGPSNDRRLVYIEWVANPSLALADNALSWIIVDGTGLLTSTTSEPNFIDNIVLGSVKTYTGSITYIQEVGHVLDNLSSNIDGTLRRNLGPIVQSGCIASPGSNGAERAVQVSSGAYSLGVASYSPTGGDNISMVGYYGGSIETAPFTNVPLQYDNAGVLTNIPLLKWAKHALYIISSLSGTTQYFFVYGQQLFTSELDAQDGPLPTPPSTFAENMCPVSGIIVTITDPSFPLTADRFRDVRPTLQFKSDGTTASADHNSLLNLTVGDAHPQYFRTDGTRTMGGDINLGTQNIVGAGGNLLNNVDITAHASRHIPGGADALPTAVPVGVGASNSEGMAQSFARADHVHAGVSSVSGTANQIATSAAQGAITLSTPSSFIAPGTIKDTSGIHYSTEIGIATTGATQGTATPITKSYNEVTSVPPNTGVILPTPSLTGLRIVIVNRGANVLCVYPNVGAIIDNAAINEPVMIPSGSTGTYEAASATQWYAVVPPVVAGSGTTVTYDKGNTIVNSSGVSTFSGGSTGLLPSSPTSGDIVLSGTLDADNGGTGFSSYAIGDLLVADTVSTLAKLPDVATGNSLISGGVGAPPAWGKIGLTTHITGILDETNGGTGRSSYTTGDLLYASASSTLTTLADVAQGNSLISGGIGAAPTWGKIGLTTHVTGTLSATNGGTGNNSYVVGDILVADTVSSLARLPDVSVGNALISQGVGAPPAWGKIDLSTTTTGILDETNGGTGKSSYQIGDLLYADTNTSLDALADVAQGNSLISGGVGVAPLWGKVGLTTHVTGVLPATNGGTGNNSYVVGDLLVADTVSTLARLPDVSIGNALISQGVGAPPTWGKINLSTTASGTLQAAQVPAFTGDVTNSGGGSLTLTVAQNVIDNTKLADMPALSIKGNNSGALSNPQDLTVGQATAMLNLFTSTLKGLVPASGGGTSNFLRADGTWISPPTSSPGGVNTNVQYNNGGALGGSSAFNFVDGANPVVNIQGTSATTQLTVGGTTDPNNSSLYIEVASGGSEIEGLRTFFNRGAGNSGYITYDYDGLAPNIRLTDEDNDPPYVQFNIVGNGTYTSPQFNNEFGGRGGTGNGTTGFSWRINDTEVSTMDSQYLSPPAGTTGQRPTGVEGMTRYNTTARNMEVFVPNVWKSLSGVVDKSTATQSFSSGANNIVSYVVPGGTLGTDGILRIKTSGIWISPFQNGRNFVMTISYGGVVLWQDTSRNQQAGVTAGWTMEVDIFANQNIISQVLNGKIMIGRNDVPTIGVGGIGTDEITANGIIYGTSAINSNVDQLLTISVAPNGGNQTFTKNIHTIELL